jgi:hypothetical protein
VHCIGAYVALLTPLKFRSYSLAHVPVSLSQLVNCESVYRHYGMISATSPDALFPKTGNYLGELQNTRLIFASLSLAPEKRHGIP